MPAEERETARYSSDLVANFAVQAFLQRRLSRALMRTRAAALMARLERACVPVPGRPQAYRAAQRRLIAFRAAASWGATDYLAVMPDLCVRAVEEGEEFEGGYFALSTAEFDVTAYLHLGIPHPAIPTGPPAPLVCPCGVNSGPRSCSASNGEVDAYMDSLASCGGNFDYHFSSNTRRHNQWRDTWTAFVRAMSAAAVDEPRDFDDGRVRPDIAMASLRGRGLWLCDVVITCPTCSTNFGAGAFIDGQAVAAAEQRKLTVYGRSLWAAEQPPPRFIPLAGSTLGRIGAHARGFMTELLRAGRADRLRLNRQHLNLHQAPTYWRRRISISLRAVVAFVILQRLRAARQQGAESGGSGGARRARGRLLSNTLGWRERARHHAVAMRRADEGVVGGAGGDMVGTGFASRWGD